MDINWPRNHGPTRQPHAFTRRLINKIANGGVVSLEDRRSAILFECARGELTYKEIANISRGLIYTNSAVPGLSAQMIGNLARKCGIVRHRNPTIHRGWRFKTLHAA